MKKIIFIIFIFIVFTQCTWTPRTVLPKEFRVIYVNKLANDTLQPDLTESFTSKVIEKFELDGRLTVTDYVSKAHGVIFSTITKYKKVPLTYSYTGELDSNALTIGLKVQVRDIKTGKWLHDNYIEQTTQFNLKSEPIESELEAQNRLIDLLATKLVSKVNEGW